MIILSSTKLLSMPRRGRLHIPGGCYHVMGRGLERRHIFEKPVDKKDFLSRFGENLQRQNAQCLAWAIMPNHYHLLIRAGTQPLRKLMAPVLGGFAGGYNRRYRRCGYVFQNRFTSILCDENSYLLELVRYIHLNPLRAKIVDSISELGKYPWTGHAGVLGRHRQEWHQVDEMLLNFGKRRGQARNKYVDFVKAGVSSSERIDLSGGGLVRSHGSWESIERFRKEHLFCIGDERILGKSDFVAQALKADEIAIESKSKLTREGWDLEKLIDHVCEHYWVDRADLYERSRKGQISEAKATICYLGMDRLGLKAGKIANHLGISQPAVSKWVSKGRKVYQADSWSDVFR